MPMQILSRKSNLERLDEKMIGHALRYAADGFAVFPVYEPNPDGGCSCAVEGCQGKHPRTAHGCNDATTDKQIIEGWWTKWPSANIGIATGKKSGVSVVDLDGMVGVASGKRLRLMSTVVALTGSGEQLFFADPNGLLNNSVKKLAAGIDIRGNGGYVIVPPSLHLNGKRYTWRTRPLSRIGLPSFPSILTEQILKPPISTSTIRKPEGWISLALDEMRQGHVHNTLVSVLGKFRAHNFNEEETYKLLYPHALVDGKPFEGLKEKIDELWQRYQPLASVSGATESIDQFLDKITEVDWICKPFFAKKSFGFVVGLPETLKTWLLIDLAVESARVSGNWLGTFAVTPSRVLFIDQERFKGETQRRFGAVIAGKGLTRSDLKGRLFLKCGTTIKLDREDSLRAFRAELLSLQPDMVIVDSFATFHDSPENDRMAIQQVLNKIKALRDEIGCSFVFINHESKLAYPNGEAQGEPHMGTMAGSVGIGAAAEFCLTVRKVEQGISAVWHTKSTLAPAHKSFYAAIKDTDSGVEIKALED